MFSISLSDTRDRDVAFYGDSGFPEIYVGRSSYASGIEIESFHHIDSKDTVQLIYIGRYTAIAKNLQIYCDMNHDYRSVYMGVIAGFENPDADDSREKRGQTYRNMHRKGMVIIGNDVWIGNNVTLIADVVIGNGAVIAAGSVVTKDVEPYSIMAGNPARKVGSRFSADQTDSMMKISWWNWSVREIIDAKDKLQGDPTEFISEYSDSITKDLGKALSIDIDADKPTILTYIDVESEYETVYDVVDQFCQNSDRIDTNFILAYMEDREKERTVVHQLRETLDELADAYGIRTIGIVSSNEEYLISQCDYMIVGRDTRNIERIAYALKYGVKLLSGVDIPIFDNKGINI